MKRRLSLNVNGYEGCAEYEELDIQEVFLPFLKRIIQLQKEKQKRIIVFIAAPPATGKSTLVMALCQFAQELSFRDIQCVGMDGFHYPNAWLATHMHQGKPLKDIKGAPETFDVDALYACIEETKQKDTYWPIYDRNIHDPIADQIFVDRSILLVEGNYLLLEEEPYQKLAELCDYSVWIQAKEEMLKERLIQRKQRGGITREAAEQFYEKSDRSNVVRVLHGSSCGDETWELDAEGCFHVLNMKKAGTNG